MPVYDSRWPCEGKRTDQTDGYQENNGTDLTVYVHSVHDISRLSGISRVRSLLRLQRNVQRFTDRSSAEQFHARYFTLPQAQEAWHNTTFET